MVKTQFYHEFVGTVITQNVLIVQQNESASVDRVECVARLTVPEAASPKFTQTWTQHRDVVHMHWIEHEYGWHNGEGADQGAWLRA